MNGDVEVTTEKLFCATCGRDVRELWRVDDLPALHCYRCAAALAGVRPRVRPQPAGEYGHYSGAVTWLRKEEE